MRRTFVIRLVGLIAFAFTKLLSAQLYDVDREGHDSLKKPSPLYLLISSSLKHDVQLMEYNNYNIYGELGIKKLYKYGLLFSISADNFKIANETVHEIGTMELSYRDMDLSRFSPEILAHYHWYDALSGYLNRKYIGANLRFQISEKTGFDFYSALGVMFQDEYWKYSGNYQEIYGIPSEGNSEQLRYYGYVKSAKQIAQKFDVSGEVTFQGDIRNIESIEDLRWNIFFRATYDITQNFQLSFNYYYLHYEKALKAIAPINKGYMLRLGVIL